MSESTKFLLPEIEGKLDLPQAIGMVVPFDLSLDAECWRWLPEDTSLFITRTPHIENTAITVDLAREVSDELTISSAVKSLLAGVPGCVSYACSSGSFVKGVEGEKHLQKVMLDAGAPKAVTTSGAMVMALKELGIKRIAVATPYNVTLSDMLNYFLKDAGIEVVSTIYLDVEEGIARIPYETVRSMAKAVNRPEAEAIFFSCTNLRTFDIIEELEDELGKPVLSANQVTVWAALKLAGFGLPHLGQSLFKTARDSFHSERQQITTQLDEEAN